MKRGGLKRKIPIEIRETKEQRSVACNKRRRTIFSKSADLCRFSGANIAVFVTSPAESSDVVYSFSGYSTANEIVDCYFNGKPLPKKINPQEAKLGFFWDDPDLYRNCDDLSELSFIEDRLKNLKKDVMECLEKKDRLQLGSGFDHNVTSCGSDQNPNFFVEEILQGGLLSASDQSFGFENGTEGENYALSLTHETQTEPMISFNEESFWDNQFNDDILGVNSEFNHQDLFDIGEILNEEIEY